MPAEHVTSRTTLDELLEGLADAPRLPVAGIAVDSRRLVRGSLFLAVRGARHHGLEFIEQAVAAGAAAIAFDASTAAKVRAGAAIPLIPVKELDRHVGDIANRFYDTPSLRMAVVGVTGTNGKTTVAWMIARSLARLGRRCGYSGTLGFGVSAIAGGGEMTSPDAVELQSRLAEFADEGAAYAAIEVSSHALDQRRVDGTQFDAVLLTNLSRDHIDYHGDMTAYAGAKTKLFTEYPARCRIINVDSGFGAELATRCGDAVIAVSTDIERVPDGRRHVFVRSVIERPNGSEVRLRTSWGDARLLVPLPGEFNVANAALVLAYLLSAGIDKHDACKAIAKIDAPPGRMQRVVASASGPDVYVDFAHTPDALEAALAALRAHCRGRIWCVFGCGGDRDRGKRPIMGRIAERLADHVVITNDNPRGEVPGDIVADILAGFTEAGAAAVVPDRAQAIGRAIVAAEPGDTVLIAGKGHERMQIIGAESLPFSDYGVALARLEALGREAGE